MGVEMETALDLPAVHRAIQDLDEAAIVDLASQVASSARGSWFTTARAIGELQRRAGYRDAAVATYAKRLKMGKTAAFELGAIDRKILLPRLAEQGDAAKFPIREKLFYVLACKLAPTVKRSPLAVLAVAEQARAKGRFSTRQLREHFGVELAAPAGRVAKSLAVVAGLQKKEREAFARGVEDPAEVIGLAERAAANARALVAELRGQEQA